MALLAAGFILGYWLAHRYGPLPADRVTNGLYPPALVGALLEMVCSIPLLFGLGQRYTHYLRQAETRSKGALLGIWLLITLAGGVLYLFAYRAHLAQMPPTLGSHFRLFFVSPPLYLIVVALTAVGLTIRALRD